MNEEKKNELYQEYLEKGRAICQKYEEAISAIYKKNEKNGVTIRDASAYEERILEKKKYEELKKLAAVYRAKCNE